MITLNFYFQLNAMKTTIVPSGPFKNTWTLQKNAVSWCRWNCLIPKRLNRQKILKGRLQIFGTMHKKMQISLKWLKYRLKILKSSFIYYFYIVPVVPKLKKLKKSPYDQNNRNWMSHWHHANYHIFCNFHWKFGTQPLKHFISIST